MAVNQLVNPLIAVTLTRCPSSKCWNKDHRGFLERAHSNSGIPSSNVY